MCSWVTLVIVDCIHLKYYVEINKEGFFPTEVNSSKVQEDLSKKILRSKEPQAAVLV